MIRKLLKNDGKIVDATLKGGNISPHIFIDEIDDGGDFVIAEILIEVFEELRARVGRGIIINSGYRSIEKQKRLREYYSSIGHKTHAATRSPHCEGMALDLNCADKVEVANMVGIIRSIRDNGKPYIRIGWKQYLNEGYHFVHIDVCPFFFNSKDGVMKTAEVPEPWRQYFCEW